LNDKIQRHLKSVGAVLRAYYDATKTLRSPTVLGDLRERFVREALSFFLPSTHEILSGELTDYSGKTSNQQDVVIYRRDVPKLRVAEGPGLLFIEGAKATIEVKSNLTWESFRDALNNVS